MGPLTQQDPNGIGGGPNVYGVANGDPVNFSDPFGLKPCEDEEGVVVPCEVSEPGLDFIAAHSAVGGCCHTSSPVSNGFSPKIPSSPGFGGVRSLQYMLADWDCEQTEGGRHDRTPTTWYRDRSTETERKGGRAAHAFALAGWRGAALRWTIRTPHAYAFV